MLRRSGFLVVSLSILSLLAFQVTPAFAHHKDTHDGGQSVQQADAEASDRDGDADSDSSTSHTEDNDTNDGGTPDNLADEGDNAHPSGRDKSVENGGSGTQGKSESNPDDSKGPMRYEGELGDDKPNGPGGTDLADQDGNNGCGNDDDFDDDNNGWCGKPADSPSGVLGSSAEICVEDAMTATMCDDSDDEVEASVDVRSDDVLADEETLSGAGADDDSVLGVILRAGTPVSGATVAASEVAAAPSGALPFTGATALVPYALLGLGMIGTGTILARRDP